MSVPGVFVTFGLAILIRTVKEELVKFGVASMLVTFERKRYAFAANEKGEIHSMDNVAKAYAALHYRRSKSQNAIAQIEHA